MRKKDHYKTLGVDKMVDRSAIRAAFRELAKKHHPDVSGPEETRRFQEIVEAYTVLSDPQSRSAYNLLLARLEAPRPAHAPPRCAEPLKAGRKSRFPQTSYSGSRVCGAEKLFERMFKGSAKRSPEYRRFPDDDILDVEVTLSEEEAAGGGVLPMWYPLRKRCPVCRGGGLAGRFICPACSGRGSLFMKKTVRIRLPGGIGDGAIFDVAVEEQGSRGIVLRLHIRVGAG